MVCKYFIDKYGVDPPVINGDQMPLHRNQVARQKMMPLKNESMYVKEELHALQIKGNSLYPGCK